MAPAPSADVVRSGTRLGPFPPSGTLFAPAAGMEITEGTRLEKALVIAACFPFLMLGLLFLFS
jgi:hypothetical protein